MMYQALVSFTGLISMAKGDVKEISDISLANDLLKAGYIVNISEPITEKEQKNVTEKKARSPKRKEKKDGN